jgi:hypothetical protein
MWIPIKRGHLYFPIERDTYRVLWDRPYHSREMCEAACDALSRHPGDEIVADIEANEIMREQTSC